MPILLRHNPKLFYMESECSFETDTIVITNTKRGLELGKVCSWNRTPFQQALDSYEQIKEHEQIKQYEKTKEYEQNKDEHPLLKQCTGEVLAIATRADYKKQIELLEKARDLKWYLRAHMRERKMPAKVIDIDITLDQNLLTVFYHSIAHVDMSILIPDIARYLKTRIRINFLSIRISKYEYYNTMPILGLCVRENCSDLLRGYNDSDLALFDEQNIGYDHDFFTGSCGMPWCSLIKPEDYEDDYVEIVRCF